VLILCVAAIVAGLTFWAASRRHPKIWNQHDLLSLIPPGESTVFFADFSTLRQAGLVGLLRQIEVSDQNRYHEFVSQTGFDYVQDVDQLAGEISDSRELYFIARAHFDWERLARYASAHGGSCEHRFCKTPTSSAGRWASFRMIDQSVLALAVAADPNAVTRLAQHSNPVTSLSSREPVWAELSPKLLRDIPAESPTIGVLRSADRVTLSAGAGTQNPKIIEVQMRAAYRSPEAARAARNQLQIETQMFGFGLRKNGLSANATDLTGLLVSGSFQVENDDVIGKWPVSKAFLKTLE
jgi:hypothetical protein